MNVGLLFQRNRLRNPDGLATWWGDRQLTHAELDDRADRLANLLRDKFKVERNQCVPIFAANRLEVVEVLGGCAKAGAVYVGLNFRMSEQDLRGFFGLVSPRVIFAAGEFREVSEIFGKEFDCPVVDLDDDTEEGYEALLRASSNAPSKLLHDILHTDDFAVVPTSGTTGVPKGVHFDHGASLAHGALSQIEFEINGNSRYLVHIPHNSSVNTWIVPALMCGAAIGFLDGRRFEPGRFTDETERRQITHTFLVPTQLVRILADPPEPKRLSSLETIGYGSSPISPDKLGELLDLVGPKLVQLYGMAEVASIATLLRKQDHVDAIGPHPELLASAGTPSQMLDVRIVDDAGNDVGAGERGEVIFRGQHLMKGYYNDPNRTAETIIDGWVHSGDIAEMDERGYYYIVDRMKNLIIRGGYNIVPTEIENVIYRHPGVLEVAVIGTPDVEWGEAVTAVVAPKAGITITEAEILDLCRSSELTSIKCPEKVDFLESLPKNAVGKIEKRTIRDTYWSGRRRV